MTQSNIDTNRRVTKQDVGKALVALGSLPKRTSDEADMDLAAYLVALDGVLACDLACAVRSILQGALRHAFFPSPPEFRMRCDSHADERASHAERDRHRRRLIEERLPTVVHSPDQRSRVAAIYKRFLETWRGTSEEEEIEAIRAKYDPDLLKQIPDRPGGGGVES